MRHKTSDWRGPYRSEAGVAMMIARQLRREMVERYGRQTNGQSAWKIAWTPEDPIATWLVLGEQNRWIRRASDPRFTRESFTRCADAEDLKARLAHGNWCLGTAFYLDDLCFIEQAAGAGEWLVIKQNVAFESASCGDMIEAGTFNAFLGDIKAASVEQCAVLVYRR
jgi:hypothetical protein